MKFNDLGIFQSLKLRILGEKKILPIFLKLNFTSNAFGENGLNHNFCIEIL